MVSRAHAYACAAVSHCPHLRTRVTLKPNVCSLSYWLSSQMNQLSPSANRMGLHGPYALVVRHPTCLSRSSAHRSTYHDSSPLALPLRPSVRKLLPHASTSPSPLTNAARRHNVLGGPGSLWVGHVRKPRLREGYGHRYPVCVREQDYDRLGQLRRPVLVSSWSSGSRESEG